MPDDTQDEKDFELFRQYVRDVKPLDKPNQLSRQKLYPPRVIRKKTTESVEPAYYPLTDQETENIHAESFLSFAREGLQARYLRKLKSGRFRPEAVLDLHGHTLNQARQALLDFLSVSQSSGLRIVKINHGKSKKLAAKPGYAISLQ
jgi:DNA-nicking Smr family endonuclease